MNEIIAYCCLICQGCPIYLASREMNGEKRQKMREGDKLMGQGPGGPPVQLFPYTETAYFLDVMDGQIMLILSKIIINIC